MGLKKWFWLVLVLVFAPSPVLAAPGMSLMVSPLPINLIADPGSTVSAQLKIKNNGLTTETLEVGLMKFQAYGEDGKPKLLERGKSDDYFDWVKFDPGVFELGPNEWKTIKMTIDVPQSASAGYYYAVTFSRKDNDVPNGARSTKIIASAATMVLLEVRVPNAIRDLEVVEFSTPKRIYEFLPANFEIKLSNKGNVHIVPRGDIFIEGQGKKDLAVLPFNEYGGNVLPDSKRVFSVDWTDGFPVYVDRIEGQKVATDKLGNNIKDLKWDFSQIMKLRIGKYTANLLLTYDDGKRDIPIESKVTFYILPWRILGGLAFVAILVLVGIFSLISVVVRKVKSNGRHNR